MKVHWQYLKYVLIHKWWVLWECCRLGIPIRGLLHDLSKFSRAEWRPYAVYFYEDSNMLSDHVRFKRAWRHHWGQNDHHWQFWAGRPIPKGARKEMLADWRAMARIKGGTVREWFDQQHELFIHPETKAWLRARM
jgi:hypothetical protein